MPEPAPARDYPIGPRRRAALYGVWALVSLPLVAGGLAAREWALVATGGLVSAILLPIFAWAIHVARLSLTADGIEARQAGARLQSPWSNVAALRLWPGAEGFVLHAPMAGSGAERLGAAAGIRIYGASLNDDDRRRLMAEGRFIPIEAFAHWLRHGDLKKTIARHAPGLVEEGERALPSGPKTGPSGPRLALIVGLTILAVGAALWAVTLPAGSQDRVARALAFAIGVALPILGIRNLAAAWQGLRDGRLALALLWGSLAAAQFLLALAALGRAIE